MLDNQPIDLFLLPVVSIVWGHFTNPGVEEAGC